MTLTNRQWYDAIRNDDFAIAIYRLALIKMMQVWQEPAANTLESKVRKEFAKEIIRDVRLISDNPPMLRSLILSVANEIESLEDPTIPEKVNALIELAIAIRISDAQALQQ